MTNNKKVVVVGGGIAGILSAILLAQKGYSVHLIEKQKDIGGLLRSIKTELGYFDYGTHLLRETGIQELDNILFDEVSRKNNWIVLDYPKAANYFKNLNEENGFVDLRDLGERYNEAMVELLSSSNRLSHEIDSLEEQLISVYGKTIVELIHKPVLEKFYATPFNTLASDAHLLFSLSRFIGFDKETTNRLKSIPLYDSKLAFTSFSEGISARRSFYPDKGGVGTWIDRLQKKLEALNVNIINSNAVQTIERNGLEIESITLENGKKLPVDHLVWTIPAFFLLRAAKVKLERSFKPPKRLKTYLFNYIIDQKYLIDVHYLECFAPDLATFRITLYDNILQYDKGRYRISVEVLSDSSENVEALTDKILGELKTMRIISQEATVLFQNGSMIAAGFPVPTRDFREAVEYQNNLLMNKFSNVSLFGKGSGKKFFMHDVLVDVFHNINKNF